MNDEKRYAVWCRDDQSVVSCVEKVKVMNENLDEIVQAMQDAFEDGILMEVSEAQMKTVLHQLVDRLHNPYSR
ncbi:hypothetical protein GCM10007860_24170 [Chitiniphilus shinanonensis]|uniref:Uncharacterized protein n=1 Tax=Chitiniphilus shinanonensis TaxID=553088 RepID=A0ABQ6BV66_9NEIS|nr:hypothetical protein [Chitiniphilus shinanonensis]GLS05267.1 hypothetical protein GCM10007860_24170 [Chitiniphilus shinanonensis]